MIRIGGPGIAYQHIVLAIRDDCLRREQTNFCGHFRRCSDDACGTHRLAHVLRREMVGRCSFQEEQCLQSRSCRDGDGVADDQFTDLQKW